MSSCSKTSQDDDALTARNLPAALVLTHWVLRDGRNPIALLARAPRYAPTFEQAAAEPKGQAAIDRIMQDVGVANGEASVSLEELAATIVRYAPSTRHTIMNSVEKLIERGRREGLQQGRREGEAHALRNALLTIVDARDLHLTDAQRNRIASCDDPSDLHHWLTKAATADHPDEIFD